MDTVLIQTCAGAFLALATLPGLGRGDVQVQGGTAAFGVDFGCSPVLGDPPGIDSVNVFYEEADLLVKPSGGTSNWHGWGSVSWSYSAGETAHFVAGGGSQEGFNGSLCSLPAGGNGWTYGLGHGEVSWTLTLDCPYRYTGVVTGGVSGLVDGTGVLPAGTHTISGSTAGDSGGFSLDVTLTPMPPVPLDFGSVPGCGQTAADVLLKSFTDGAGNRFEILCTDQDPHVDEYHMLFYGPGETQGKLVGRCPFERGCNTAEILHTGDCDGDGVPDRFLSSVWTSRDEQYGDQDDDGDGEVFCEDDIDSILAQRSRKKRPSPATSAASRKHEVGTYLGHLRPPPLPVVPTVACAILSPQQAAAAAARGVAVAYADVVM